MRIEKSWQIVLKEETKKPYFKKLADFVKSEYLNQEIYPEAKDMLRAFDRCPFESVKVVIVGQDPYHGPNQANGLCFAVHKSVALPPSLKNIFKEIENDIGVKPINDGDLSRWADQGVLLLNATLTVSAHTPGSHQKKGWEEFTDEVIRKLSTDREHIVFILWGKYAQEKGKVIDTKKHCVLESPHPSPFSVHSGFFGCKHFSRANKYLKKCGIKEIDWR